MKPYLSNNNKRRNNSFISNQDLIEGMRNHSFRNLTKTSLEKKSSVGLIQKKSFIEKENRAIENQKTIEGLSLNQEIIRMLKLLSMQCKDKRLVNQTEQLIEKVKKEQTAPNKQEASLLKKIEELYVQKNRLKKQKKKLQDKIKQLTSLRSSRKQKTSQDDHLHKLILKQSELLNKQAQENQETKQSLHRILQTQAKAIEKSLMFKF